MSTTAQTPLSPEEAAKLPRVYLVPAEDVQEFYDLMREAEEAAEGDSNDEEIEALQAAVEYAAEAFRASKIVKARFK